MTSYSMQDWHIRAWTCESDQLNWVEKYQFQMINKLINTINFWMDLFPKSITINQADYDQSAGCHSYWYLCSLFNKASLACSSYRSWDHWVLAASSLLGFRNLLFGLWTQKWTSIGCLYFGGLCCCSQHWFFRIACTSCRIDSATSSLLSSDLWTSL